MRFPFRSQLEGADCGPACIQMIAAYYGKQISLSALKDYCHVTRLGIALKDIIDGCNQIGIRAVAVHLAKEKIKEAPLPTILYWKQEHYVILYQIKRKNEKTLYYIADPAYGKIKLEELIFLEAWVPNGDKGIAILVEPQEKFDKTVQEATTLKQQIRPLLSILRNLSSQKRNILHILFLSGIIFGCGLAIPFLLQKLMDEGIAFKNMNWVILILLGQLALYLGNQLSTIANNYLLYRTGLNIGLEISTRYIWKLVKLPAKLFDTKLGTDFLQRLNDEEQIRNFLTYTASSLLFIMLNFLIYSCVLAHYNLYIFGVFLLFGISSMLMTYWLLKIRKQLNYALFLGLSKKKNIENELVYGMMEIKINAAHRVFLAQWEKLQKVINSHALKSLLYESSINSGNSILGILRDILITGGCAYLVIKGEMTVGIMLTITYILGQLSGSMNQITTYSHTYQDAILAYNRMEDILKVADENEYENKVLHLPQQGFNLNNVFFKYEGSFNPYVLNNINIEIPTNRVTAIVGASGSGKTTLLKLLLAFYYPQKGTLKIGGETMDSINIDEWRKKCGVVMQDGYIFSGSIANNIALSDETPNMKRLVQATRIACIDSFIERLPMKYHTKIGKSGMDLSGGQKQRILIARAVYKNPDFIFFDEATSSLDAGNEKEIMDNLKQFYKNRTVIIIAHRLSTVKDADNIIVLDKGSIIEQGTHQELTATQGLYYSLVKNQLELGQ